MAIKSTDRNEDKDEGLDPAVIAELAAAARAYRVGIADLVEAGFDIDAIEDAVDEAELEIEEQEGRVKASKQKLSVRKRLRF